MSHRQLRKAIVLQNDSLDFKHVKQQTFCIEDVRTLHMYLRREEEEEEKQTKPVIRIVQTDTLTAASRMILEEDLNPLVLNMASSCRKSYRKGDFSQEAELYRRTTLFRDEHKMLPLQTYQAYIHQGVVAFRDTAYRIMTKEEEWFAMDIISMTAGEHMQAKIRALFLIALMMGKDSLLLAAWDNTATLFRDAIQRYGHHFKVIEFAILGARLPIYQQIFP